MIRLMCDYTRLRWFAHVKKRSVNAPVRRCDAINLLHCRRGRRRPKMSWNEVIRSDMKFMGLKEIWHKIKTFGNLGLKL